MVLLVDVAGVTAVVERVIVAVVLRMILAKYCLYMQNDRQRERG